MSRRDNYIDLTLESDDEIKGRSSTDIRAPPAVLLNQIRPRLPPQPVRIDIQPQPSPSIPIQPIASQRQRSTPFQYLPPTRRPDISYTLHRGLNYSQLYASEALRVYSGNPRLSTIVSSAPPKPQQRACVYCLEVRTTCDGEKPCSACVEPGLPCHYPGETPVQQDAKTSIKERAPVAIPPRPSIFQDVDTTIPVVGHAHPHTSKVEAEAFYDSDDSEDDDIPLAVADLGEVKELLRKHEARMREHRAYLLQPLLNQAMRDAVKAPQPAKLGGKNKPFASLIERHSACVNHTSGASPTIQIQLKSHRNGAAKKWTQRLTTLTVVDADSTILPKYKSIGRLGTSLLAPNIRTLKYWPYFPDEENLDPSEAKKNEELEERYQHDDNHLLAQRKCAELVEIWEPWVKDFVSKLQIRFQDILYWFLHASDKMTCDTCEREILADAFVNVSKVLTKPTDRALTLARLSTTAVKEIAKVSMWHFVLAAPSVKDVMNQIEPDKPRSATLCSVCFLHNCLSHGAYQEPEESGGAIVLGGNVEINDEESNHNVRLLAGIPNHDYHEQHQCGLYCTAAESRLKDLLGWRRDGTIGGIHNHAVTVPRPVLKNDAVCGEHCYWLVDKRTKFGTVQHTNSFELDLPDSSKALFKELLKIYGNNQRAPCMIAKEISGLKCMDAFYYMLAEFQRTSHFRQAVANSTQQSIRKASKIAFGLDTTLSADLDERPPFIPCHHSGSCLNNSECTCFLNKIHCEWFCGCDKTCERRFPGCRCASTNKTCFNDKSCECWKHNRECDPWLCGTCGVVEVLDPRNKYNDEIRQGRCKNNRMQLDLPARTIKAPSEVQGWGLYAGVDLEETAFIGEYKGETVGNQESDRRGAVYANIGQEYLFVMNRDQQIDGSNFGNKTRFINNSQRDDYINVFAKKLLCNGIQRVMLYAKRPIKAGEELLYNYNYPISVTKKFWERGEGPTNVPGAVVAKPSIPWSQPRVNGRFAKVASKLDDEQSLPVTDLVIDDERSTKKDSKRKRASEADTQHITMPQDNDFDDSDFELIEHSESSESIDEADADSDPAEDSIGTRKRRVVYPHDRRRGGLAQVKAWETRRKRNGKG